MLFERMHCACPSQKKDLQDPYQGEFSSLKHILNTKIDRNIESEKYSFDDEFELDEKSRIIHNIVNLE